MEKKMYDNLELEIISFEVEDVLKPSNIVTGGDDFEFPGFDDPIL
jgi:hypothetical protein